MTSYGSSQICFNQLMVIPNVIALFALTGMVLHIEHTRDEEKHKVVEEKKKEIIYI